jgi:hypothetical protein
MAGAIPWNWTREPARLTATLRQQMSRNIDPQTFADEWIAAWNARDLDRILSHYAEKVVFRSPRIVEVTGDATCVVRGIDALRAYWRQALDRNPNLRFELDRVYASKDAITIAYRNHRGQNAAETLIFDERGLVTEGLAAYAS